MTIDEIVTASIIVLCCLFVPFALAVGMYQTDPATIEKKYQERTQTEK